MWSLPHCTSSEGDHMTEKREERGEREDG